MRYLVQSFQMLGIVEYDVGYGSAVQGAVFA